MKRASNGAIPIKNYKQETMKYTGMSKAEYTKAYDVFKIKVRNYNRLTGAQLSASEQFYYYSKQIASQTKKGLTIEQAKQTLYPRLADIANTTSASISKARFDARREAYEVSLSKHSDIIGHLKLRYAGILGGKDYLKSISGQDIYNKWKADLKQLFEDYENGLLTIEDVYKLSTAIANDYNARHIQATSDALIGSK